MVALLFCTLYLLEACGVFEYSTKRSTNKLTEIRTSKSVHDETQQTAVQRDTLIMKFERSARYILGNQFVDKIINGIEWVFNKPNPLIQIFYLVIAVGGFVVYVNVGFRKYCPGPYLAEYHKITGSIVMFACYYSFYKACSVDPGIIKDKKQAKLVK